MILGFTGTQGQLTTDQFDVLSTIVKELQIIAGVTKEPVTGHHGDCVGADYIFHAICLELNIPVMIHPPINDSQRAYCENADTVLPAKEYIARNHDIVDAADIVIACPPTVDKLQRSGTWSTWRYAKKTNKETYLILPTGAIKHVR